MLPGLGVAVIIAVAATIGGPYAPLFGAPVLAILFGVVLRTAVPLPKTLQPGIAYTARSVLQFAIIISGFSVSLATIATTGIGTLPVTLFTIAVALVLAWALGRALGLDGTLRALVGIGTAICGASAIAAVSTVVESSEAETALAISTIFLYNIVAVLTFPPLGHALALSQMQFGVWAGTAINDTSSVVAAGFSYGQEAGTHATIVKLTRATLILPIVGILALWRARRASGTGKAIPWKRIVPWFILWFLVAALINTTGVVPVTWNHGIADVSTFLISAALAAIGLQTSLPALFGAGWRPLLLGLLLWLAVAGSSLAVQHVTGT